MEIEHEDKGKCKKIKFKKYRQAGLLKQAREYCLA